MNLLAKDRQQQTFLNSYEVLSVIQQGSQAKILLARKNGQLFGIKVYKHGYKGLKTFCNEIEILEAINDNLVVKPLQFYQLQKNLLDDQMKENVEPFLVMEYFQHGDLRHYLNKGNMAKRIRNHVLKNLALCLAAIQSRGILHCDIKPENFLISSDYIIKIIDFGYGMQKDKLRQQLVGTSRYIAPELYKEKKYSQKSQVFALGVIFFQLALPAHEFPFKGATITDPNYLQIYQKNYTKFWSKFNSGGIQAEYKKLIQKMISVNPEERPTVRDILSCSFLQDSGSLEQCKQYFTCLKPIIKGIKLENCHTY